MSRATAILVAVGTVISAMILVQSMDNEGFDTDEMIMMREFDNLAVASKEAIIQFKEAGMLKWVGPEDYTPMKKPLSKSGTHYQNEIIVPAGKDKAFVSLDSFSEKYVVKFSDVSQATEVLIHAIATVNNRCYKMVVKVATNVLEPRCFWPFLCCKRIVEVENTLQMAGLETIKEGEAIVTTIDGNVDIQAAESIEGSLDTFSSTSVSPLVVEMKLNKNNDA